jgi:hypothetical protein
MQLPLRGDPPLACWGNASGQARTDRDTRGRRDSGPPYHPGTAQGLGPYARQHRPGLASVVFFPFVSSVL